MLIFECENVDRMGCYEYFDFCNYSIFLEILQDNFMIILNKFKWFDKNVDFMWCLSRVE